MKKLLLTKSLLAAALLLGGTNAAMAEDWTTVWSADFSAAPSGMTYSVSNGAVNIDNGYLHYNQNGGSGNRAINTAFTADVFKVTTNWKMEFDWNCSASNQNQSNVVFATNKGTVFTITWEKGASTASIADANASSLTTTLPTMGTTRGSATSFAHFTITGDTENGIYLTVTKGETTYVDNVCVSQTFGYPSTFNGSLGRAYSWMYVDNIDFAIPKVEGYVAPPTGTVTAVDGTSRKFTLSCLTAGVTMYYAESDLEVGADGWKEYTGETTTSAATVYIYASDGTNNSDKNSFETGAGTAITLNAPTFSISSYNEGVSTVVLSSSQTNILFSPTASITYTINGGNETTIADGETVSVNNGETIAFWAVAAGYENSSVVTKTAVAPNSNPVLWSETYYSENNNASITRYGDEAAATIGETDYYYMQANETQISEKLVTNSNKEDNDYWLYRNAGIYAGKAKGYAILGLKAGDYVTINFSNGTEKPIPNADTNDATLDEWNSTSTSYKYNVTGETGAIRFAYARYGYINSITVQRAPATTVTATIGEAGWATLYTDKALDFSQVEGLTAYTATVSDNTVTLTKVNDVPVVSGVVLQGAAGTYEIPIIEASETDRGELTGNTDGPTSYDMAALNNGTIYILAPVNDGKDVQFVPCTSGSVAAGKAFLIIYDVQSNAKAMRVVLASETTGISNVNVSVPVPVKRIQNGQLIIEKNGKTYNAAGQLK